jgi:lipopolysaccharide heptosyltransferase I
LQTQSKFRLLVVRLGAMGDILHALPAVTALRIAHPEWVIDWVVEPKWRTLLAAEDSTGRDTNNPAAKQPVVDQLHFASTKQWRQNILSAQTRSEIAALRRSLKAGGYDTVLDLQGAIRSAVIGRMAGCRRVIGESNPRERAARWLFTERIETRGAHVIEQGVELASIVAGDELAPVQPWLPVDPVAEAWAEEILPLSAGGQAVLINPGAGWGAKRWPVERYADVARTLLGRGFRVFVNAGPGEVVLADSVVQRTGGGATSLLCSLQQLIAVTRRVALVIAGDTGPLHLACALGRPVVGIYGPTDPSRNGPFGTEFRVLRSPESRRDHTRHEAPEAGLLTIKPEDVLRAADELLYPEAAL